MTGGILSGPVGQKFGSFRRLPSGEEAPLRASQPRRAASPRGLHGSGRSAGARGARAGGGARPEGRGGAARQLRTRLPGRRSLSRSRFSLARSPAVSSRPRPGAPSPGARPQAASAGAQARPPPAGAGGHFLFEPNFAARTAGPGGSPSPARPVCGARRQSGDGDGDAPRPNSRPSPGRHPSPPPGPRGWSSRAGAGAGRAGPHLCPGARPAHRRALTPLGPARAGRTGFGTERSAGGSTRLCFPLSV